MIGKGNEKIRPHEGKAKFFKLQPAHSDYVADLQESMKEKAAAFAASGGETYQGERPAGAHDH